MGSSMPFYFSVFVPKRLGSPEGPCKKLHERETVVFIIAVFHIELGKWV